MCNKLFISHIEIYDRDCEEKQTTNFTAVKTNVIIGHFRVPKTLTFKMRLGAQPFLWKWVLFAWEWKMISISQAEHLPSFWNRGLEELGNGLFMHRRSVVTDFDVFLVLTFFREVLKMLEGWLGWKSNSIPC